MNRENTESFSHPPGRGFLWAGVALMLLAVLLFLAQFQLKRLFVPWYLPALTSVGAVLLLFSVLRTRTFARMIVFGFVLLLAVAEWYFLIVFAKLPEYDGPAHVGAMMPGFTTARADGTSFTQADLQDGTPSVMVFFRGRW